MHFCGQCGTLLFSDDATCPRCGAVTEPDINATQPDMSTEDFKADTPTVASSIAGYPPATPRTDFQRPAGPPPTPVQQKLVLRSDGAGYASNEPVAYDLRTPIPYAQPENPVSYPGFPSQQASGYQSPAEQYAPAQPAKPRRKGRTAALLIIPLVLLVALGAAFFLWQSGAFTPPTPTQQAQAVVQQYYNDINNQDYRDAYNLWGTNPQNPPPTYQQFANGYKNTRHDDITFGAITSLSNGTVQVNLTIRATETTPGGTGVRIFQGSYIVGQQNGSWKLLNGSFLQIG